MYTYTSNTTSIDIGIKIKYIPLSHSEVYWIVQGKVLLHTIYQDDVQDKEDIAHKQT